MNVGTALAERLRAAATVLLDESALERTEPDASALLLALVDDARARPAVDRLWLLWIAISTVWPRPADLDLARRELELLPAESAARRLLARCFDAAGHQGALELPLEIVVGGVLVDVDHTARHDVHTGVQRVVRSTLPRWIDRPGLVPLAWTARRGALRTLDTDEIRRVVHWDGPAGPDPDVPAPTRLVVPWRSTIVLMEVPAADLCDRLAAAAHASGNRVVALGYDAIPVGSAALVPRPETDRFVRYLSVLKHVDTIAAISASARSEFTGFADMLTTQGLPPPTVVECALPVGRARGRTHPSTRGGDLPLVVCVGAFEPRKNQAAVLTAAQLLWREGLRFELLLIGGRGVDGPSLRREVARATRRGRPVRIASGVDEDALRAAYRDARFTVFPSLHEGYGLPVAESLEHGTPVITSDVGSMREIATGGGCVLIDPRDDTALAAAMRRLLSDDDAVAQLRAEIANRPGRDWDDYAEELWRIVES